jgi:hypothetical protein
MRFWILDCRDQLIAAADEKGMSAPPGHLGGGRRRGRACPTLVDFRSGNQGNGKPSPYTAFVYQQTGGIA